MLFKEYWPTDPAPAVSEEKVRSTVSTSPDVTRPAVLPDAPEFNEQQPISPVHSGLDPKNEASAVTPSDQFVPIPIPDVNDAVQVRVNDGQATRGRAPALEETGRWGHGTFKMVEGIEPAISAAPFGPRYFAAIDHPVSSDDYMTPSGTDTNEAALAALAGKANARQASSPYDALLNYR